MTRAFHLLVLLVLALLLVPAGQAEVSVQAGAPDGPVAPEEPVPVVLEVGVDCFTLWTREVVTVGLAAMAPQNVTVEGPTEADYHKSDCPAPDGAAVKQHRFQATVSLDARAGESLPIHLKATLPGQAMEPETFGVAQVDLVPAYVPLVQARIPTQIKETGNGAATFLVLVDNHGNDDVDVTLRVVRPPGHGGTVDLPDPVRVPRGGSVEAPFTVRIDHDSWDQVIVRVAVNATRADAGDGASELYANVLLRNGSLTADFRNVPAPPLVPLALLAAVVLCRRRDRP